MTEFGISFGAGAVVPESGGRPQPKDLREACQLFESLFIHQLWKAMRETVDKSGLIDGGEGEEIFTDLLDQKTSEVMARRGGIGLAEDLYRQLSRQQMSVQTDNKVAPAGKPGKEGSI